MRQGDEKWLLWLHDYTKVLAAFEDYIFEQPVFADAWSKDVEGTLTLLTSRFLITILLPVDLPGWSDLVRSLVHLYVWWKPIMVTADFMKFASSRLSYISPVFRPLSLSPHPLPIPSHFLCPVSFATRA